MRCRVAQIASLYAAWLSICLQPVQAQQGDASVPANSSCFSSPSSYEEEASGPEIVIADLSFWGLGIQMPRSEQEQIATSITKLTLGNSLDGVIDDALERVREAWQDRGYVQVRVEGEAKTLTSSPVSQRIALSVHVEEGLQYSLREVTFKHNHLISSVEALRQLFPIRDGEIASREKIAKGLENLKDVYGTRGYINFTSIPEPTFDDANRLVSFEVDIDEGKQFFVRQINVVGLDESSKQELLKNIPLKRGQVYNFDLYRQLLSQEGLKLAQCGCDTALHLNYETGIVDFKLDFRQCPN